LKDYPTRVELAKQVVGSLWSGADLSALWKAATCRRRHLRWISSWADARWQVSALESGDKSPHSKQELLNENEVR